MIQLQELQVSAWDQLYYMHQEWLKYKLKEVPTTRNMSNFDG